jgi:hypothetical protein
MATKRKRNDKRITVISRRRPWDDAEFAKAVAAFVASQLQPAEHEGEAAREPTP